MNEPPLLPLPPFGDDTDEALSALLDGELDAFAQERGLTEGAVRAQLEAWSGGSTRLAELERARAAMHAPVPPLDDLTRRRLVRTAANARAGQPVAARRSRSWVAVTAVAAAGLLVVIGIGAAISSMDSSSKSVSSSGSASDAVATAPLRGDVGNLGDVTNPEALRALLDRRESFTGSGTGSSRSADGTANTEGGGGSPSSGTDTPPPAAAEGALDPEACADQLASGGSLAFSGTGSYRGAPVAILGITEGSRTIVFVVSSTDCSKVLASVSR